MKGYRLTGPDRERALDLLHVRAEVLGVQEDVEGLSVWLRDPMPDLGDLRVRSAVLPEEDRLWTGLEEDRAIPVGADLLIRPPWVEAPEGFAGIELVVPRGSAFGSGEHGSTRAALLLLHALWPGEVASFADVGTGSGILALYAVRRGCRTVMACDIEPQAVAGGRRLLPDAQVFLGGPELFPHPADAVVANLAGHELAAALDAILRAWTGCGPLVLSGMRASEVEGVEAGVGLSRAERVERDGFTALGWTGGPGTRRSGPGRRPP